MHASTIPVLVPVLVLASAALLGCHQEDSRPVKEVVAQAKGAAAEASDSTKAAAADAKEVASEAASEVRAGVGKAQDAAEAAAARATARADQAVTSAAQGVRELGQGGVVVGRVSAYSAHRLTLHPERTGPSELRLDAHTRYLLEGAQLRAGGLAAGTRVKAIYVVEAGVPVATDVEVVHR